MLLLSTLLFSKYVYQWFVWKGLKKDVSCCISQPCSSDLQFTLFYVCIVITGELLVSCPSRYPWFYIEHKKIASLIHLSIGIPGGSLYPIQIFIMLLVAMVAQFMTILVRAVIEHTCFQPTVFFNLLSKKRHFYFYIFKFTFFTLGLILGRNS